MRKFYKVILLIKIRRGWHLDIFVDTGVVFGYEYNDDTFFPVCQSLFEGKEFRDNRYYTSLGIVNQEIDRIREARLKGFKKFVRLFAIKAATRAERLIDVSMGNHPKYRELTDQLYKFLVLVRKDTKRKQNDSILLSNSHLWSVTRQGLVNPQFLTTDKGDIFDNSTQINQIVNTCLSIQCTLKIDYVPYFIQKERAN